MKRKLIVLLGATFFVAHVQAMEKNSLPGIAKQPQEYFFTGKPYDSELAGFLFKYRNYDPTMNRWTSADPSGFPDGLNNSNYAPNPLSQYDAFGLYTSGEAARDFSLVSDARYLWSLAGYTMSIRRADNSLWYGPNETAPTADTNAMKASSYFTSIFDQAFFSGLVGDVGKKSPYNETRLVGFSGATDLHTSYGRVNFTVTGEFTWNTSNLWSTVATFTFTDIYDFDPNSSVAAIAAFARLQANNYAGTYNTSGQFTVTYNE